MPNRTWEVGFQNFGGGWCRVLAQLYLYSRRPDSLPNLEGKFGGHPSNLLGKNIGFSWSSPKHPMILDAVRWLFWGLRLDGIGVFIRPFETGKLLQNSVRPNPWLWDFSMGFAQDLTYMYIHVMYVINHMRYMHTYAGTNIYVCMYMYIHTDIES